MSPAVVVSPTTPSSSKDTSKSARHTDAAHAQSRSRKPRVVRRRGRGRLDQMDSDDEIERETMSDESDSDEPSLIDSASDSEAESESESLALRNGRHHLDTPSTTQSPPPGEVEAAAALNGFAGSKLGVDKRDGLEQSHSAPAFLSSGDTWSEMVTDEGINGAAPLPVIDFLDLHEHAATEPPHLTNQEDASGSVVSNDDTKLENDTGSQHGTERPVRGGYALRRGAPRLPGQSARQAYQQRLQTDPQFVPTVGEFWGHDDRLLQKDLRSLSGWWRGRWQGRGRGRGGFVGRGMRGHGRGGFFGGTDQPSREDENPQTQAETSDAADFSKHEHEVPLTEKLWTHDGFEKLKERETREQHRVVAQRETKRFNRPAPSVNGTTAPSRGGFVPRGRGIFRGAPSPTSSRVGSSMAQRLRSQPDRPWFIMKPEHVWTKQFEGFLFSEPSLRPKHGKPAAFRVRLPGKGSEIVRAPIPRKIAGEPSQLRSQPPSERAAGSDSGSRAIVVKLPEVSAMKEVSYVTESLTQPEPIITVEDLPDEVPVAPPTAPVQHSGDADVRPELEQPVAPSEPPQENPTATPGLTRDSSFSERSVPDVSGASIQTSQLSLESDERPPEMVPVIPGPIPPPPIQTSFAPPVQPTPSYGSPPYGYPPSLPHGIALNQQGFAYEVASGRPVYLQPTPPPPQMHIFNPRPIPYAPGHMHHHSMSGDFMLAPSTPPLNGIVDPSTGQPIFSLPRQSSRIEIRAPTEVRDPQGRIKPERRPSTLRNTTVAVSNGEANGYAAPAIQRYSSAPEYYTPEMMGGMAPHPSYQQSEGAASMSPGSEEPPMVPQQPMDPGMMGYPPYQHQYYYQEQYYPAYVEMPQQAGQYDPYGADPRHQAPVYF